MAILAASAALVLGTACAGNGVAGQHADGGGAKTDGGTSKDGSVVNDGGTVTDGGTRNDGGVVNDGGTVTDGGTPTDGGVVNDGGTVTDGGTPNDGGVITDAGTSNDGGTSCPGGGCACPGAPTAQVVIYTESAWNVIGDALASYPIPCGEYDISIPATADASGLKTMPRAGQAAAMRARGPGFHALAEFHWASWSKVTGMTWYQKGIEFRRRMVQAGYDVTQGDGWAINEVPSSVRTSATTRANVEAAVQGLYEGPSGAPTSRGIVFIIGVGQKMVNFSVYKPNLENWLTDKPFWVDMANYVRIFAQEVYTDPTYVCVPNTTVAQRSANINAYVEHLARLAAAGPSTANTAQSYFHRTYTPLMNAVWNSSGSGYGNTAISLTDMEHHVSTQVYAAKAWAASHRYPGTRIAFAFARVGGATTAQLTTLGDRLAKALLGAYRSGGTAAKACSLSGAYTWCQCKIAGDAFNPGWATFGAW